MYETHFSCCTVVGKQQKVVTVACCWYALEKWSSSSTCNDNIFAQHESKKQLVEHTNRSEAILALRSTSISLLSLFRKIWSNIPRPALCATLDTYIQSPRSSRIACGGMSIIIQKSTNALGFFVSNLHLLPLKDVFAQKQKTHHAYVWMEGHATFNNVGVWTN